MNYLTGVQTLHYEAKLPGSPPSAVTGQSGRAADLVRWYAEAYNDIQRERDGRWKWLHRDCYVDTVASTAAYASTDFTDSTDAAAISRFRGWDLSRRAPPFIYLSSDGQSTERELTIADWNRFRSLFIKATHTAAYPYCICVDRDDQIRLGPTPDDVYRVTCQYWMSNQTLAADGDTPEMPSDYHMLIVYRALVKYGYHAIGHEVLARARAEGQALYNALSLNQAYNRFQLDWPSALA